MLGKESPQDGGGAGGGGLALFPLCPASCAPPGPPAWSPWTPWSECSASCGSARRHRHRFCARPPSVVLSSGAPLPPAASPAPLCPGPEAEEEPCLLPGCDRESHRAHDSTPGDSCCLVLAPQPQPGPLPTLLPLLSPQELGAGVLGLPGPAVAGAVGEAFGAGLEPATSPHPRAWETTARGPRPRGRPARPCRAQVPARDGGGGKEQRQESCRRLSGERGWGGQPTWLSAPPAPPQ